jgi:hypothetical protein
MQRVARRRGGRRGCSKAEHALGHLTPKLPAKRARSFVAPPTINQGCARRRTVFVRVGTAAKMSLRAPSQMATTAGFLILRSAEMA